MRGSPIGFWSAMPDPACNHDSCEASVWANGYCNAHGLFIAKHGTPTCSVADCDKDASRKGMCQAHYRRVRSHGSVDLPTRNKPGPKPDPSKPRSRYGDTRKSEGTVRKYLEVGGVCPNGHRLTDESVYRYVREDNGAEKIVCKACARVRYMKYKGLDSVGAPNRDKTHCPFGHEYSAENTYVKTDGSRACRVCRINGNRARKYGLSVEDTRDMFERQGGACAICRKPFTDLSSSEIHIDHDHRCCPRKAASCGDCVRGMLCGACNHLLGKAQDDPGILRSAISYLEA